MSFLKKASTLHKNAKFYTQIEKKSIYHIFFISRPPLRDVGVCCLNDVFFKRMTLLCLTGVTLNNVDPLLRILTMRLLFNKQVRDSHIFIINQKFHSHIFLRLDVIIDKCSWFLFSLFVSGVHLAFVK